MVNKNLKIIPSFSVLYHINHLSTNNFFKSKSFKYILLVAIHMECTISLLEIFSKCNAEEIMKSRETIISPNKKIYTYTVRTKLLY